MNSFRTESQMDANFETVKYVVADKVKKGTEKYGIEILGTAKDVIKKSNPNDVLELRITINSPIKIIKAANITQNPDTLFEVIK